MPLDDRLHYHPAGQQILIEHQPGRHPVIQVKTARDQQQQPTAEQKPAFPFETGLSQQAFEGPVRHDDASYSKT